MSKEVELCVYCKKNPKWKHYDTCSEDCFYGMIYYGTKEDPGVLVTHPFKAGSND